MVSQPGRDFSPLNPERRSATWQVAAVVIATLCFSVASYLEIPMVPVPITAQTYALLTAAALLGWKLGALATLAWLALGAMGLPVLAGGAGGLAHFSGATAGYLFAFPLAVATVGWLSEPGWNPDRIVMAFLAMLLGHAICLGFGGTWLAFTIGPVDAFAKGVLPFVPGGIIKSVLVIVTIAGLYRVLGKQQS